MGGPSTPIPTSPSPNGRRGEGRPENLAVVADISEKTIIDEIESAARKTPFVVVDLEGTASMMVANRIADGAGLGPGRNTGTGGCGSQARDRSA